MKFSLALALAGTLALAACGGSEDTATTDDVAANNSDVMTAEQASGVADQLAADMTDGVPMDSGAQDDRFTAACLRSSNQTEEMCRCMSGKATANLTDNGREFLIASLNEDTDRVIALRPTMNMTELTQAGMFLVNASTECAAEGHNQ